MENDEDWNDEEWKCCQENTTCWNCFYVIGFFCFSALICWYFGFSGPLSNYETTKRALMVLGCNVFCLISTIYLFYRYKKLYPECDDRTYTPIFHTWFVASVPAILLLIWFLRVIHKGDSPEANSIWMQILGSTILGGALPEELLKYFVFVKGYSWFGLKPSDNLTLRLMVLQATAAGMAFGTLEAFQYVSMSSKGHQVYSIEENILMMTALRAFGAIPSHAMYAYISGCTYLQNYIVEASEGEESLSHRSLLCSPTTFWSIWRSFLLHAAWNTYSVLLGYVINAVAVSSSVKGQIPKGLRYYFNILMIISGVSEVIGLGVDFWVCRRQFRQLKETYGEKGACVA